MSESESAVHLFLRRLRRHPDLDKHILAVESDNPPGEADVAADAVAGMQPGGVLASEAVRRAADQAIKAEAIRQLDSIELDDEDVDGRIEPLAQFPSLGFGPPDDSDVEWDELTGRFLTEGDAHHDRG
ncbi:MAG: hypothetical protein AAF531_14180 [Actinomycetota bacterium]